MKKGLKVYMGKGLKFISKYGISIVACALMALICLLSWYVAASPGETTLTSIGQNITTAGNIIVGGGLQLGVDEDTKPDCDEANRGMVWTDRSEDEDTLFVCLKGVTKEYKWKTMTSRTGLFFFQ